MTINIRQATPADARLIALIMAEAIQEGIMQRAETSGLTQEDEKKIALLETVVRREDTLYSWRNTYIAETDNASPAGGVIAYPGNGYNKARAITFSLLHEILTFNLETMDAETVSGEYYLDSLAVLPSFRGNGIARELIQIVCQKAQQNGMPTTLACEPENIIAKTIYEEMGFQASHNIYIFGHNYIKMIRH